MGEIGIKRKEPLLGPSPDYAKVFYYDPPSHDFLVWLVISELMRRHHKAPGPLEVTFGYLQGMLGMYDFGPLGILGGKAHACGVGREYSETMIKNVLRPAIEMIGAIEMPSLDAPFDGEFIARFAEYDYHIGHLVDAGREGHEIPQFKPPAWAFAEVDAYLRGKKPVVITLRETPHQPERNSNLPEWLKFAESISDEHEVLFLRDTALADEKLSWLTWPRASKNAYVRAALYQRALVNMMVGTGPVGWCVFTDAPYLVFKQLVPALPQWEHGNESGWLRQAHMNIGDQYPWASKFQRLTWTDDTFQNMREAFDGFMDVVREENCRASAGKIRNAA